MKYKAHFIGRTAGAIGVMQRFTVDLEADTLPEAEAEFWRGIYNTHQDIMRLRFEPIIDRFFEKEPQQ